MTASEPIERLRAADPDAGVTILPSGADEDELEDVGVAEVFPLPWSSERCYKNGGVSNVPEAQHKRFAATSLLLDDAKKGFYDVLAGRVMSEEEFRKRLMPFALFRKRNAFFVGFLIRGSFTALS